MEPETLSFEKAFERLEQILHAMNSGKTPLEESLKLFEEAEKLIGMCNTKLSSAEKRIDQLIKNKAEVALDASGQPKTEPFVRA
ncbi:MAG: exodeoxyribonuclease VII small subunit [Verrucomicrobia bacterium]|nr:exodeoxyribonuclease VII small subunit [Verrucomicrobiota bacterium]MBU6446280.1 exodeoxyribonuclease VII small subunit [Verrucomicrobiota bacterium]MDE3047591.1 exodeoxyribonuclease VII small subunit [Verrucomicrobiota bacterium]